MSPIRPLPDDENASQMGDQPLLGDRSWATSDACLQEHPFATGHCELLAKM